MNDSVGKWVAVAYDAQGAFAVGFFESLESASSDAVRFLNENGGHCYIAKIVSFVEDFENGD